MSVIKSKRRRQNSVGYNSWFPIVFQPITLAASIAPTVVEARYPLGLNHKIVALSYVFSGAVAGAVSMNLVSGIGTYETAGTSSFGTITLGGTFAVGDTVTVNIGTFSSKSTVSTRTAGKLQLLAAGIARALNKNTTFAASYVASSSGAVVVVQTNAYSTAGNAVTFTAAVASAAGTATASGATLAGGTAGVVPAAITLDVSTVVPSQVVAPGQALFPVDMVLPVQADVASTMYPAAFDAIFPACSELTVRLNTSSTAAGTLQIIAYTVPVDVYPMTPEERNEGFLPGQNFI